MENTDDLVAKVKEKPISGYYKVSESIVSINKDPEKIKSFHWDEDFSGTDKLLSREKAINYYGNRLLEFNLKGINKSFFNLKYSNPEDFIPGVNYAYSLYLLFVGVYNNDETFEFYLLGGEEQDVEEGKKIELEYFQELGYDEEQIKQLETYLFYEEMLIESAIKYFKILSWNKSDTEIQDISVKDIVSKTIENYIPQPDFKAYALKRLSDMD